MRVMASVIVLERVTMLIPKPPHLTLFWNYTKHGEKRLKCSCRVHSGGGRVETQPQHAKCVISTYNILVL